MNFGTVKDLCRARFGVEARRGRCRLLVCSGGFVYDEGWVSGIGRWFGSECGGMGVFRLVYGVLRKELC